MVHEILPQRKIMSSFSHILLLLTVCFTISVKSAVIVSIENEKEVDAAAKLRSDFLKVLLSRRPLEVPLSVELAKPVEGAICHVPCINEEGAANSCPVKNNKIFKEENLYLTTEVSEQGRLPILIISKKHIVRHRKRPAVVILHSTNKCKEWMRPSLESYASRGYIAIAIDSRYHGERGNLTKYMNALVQSWKTGDTMPYIYDTVWDLIKLADYLTQRKEIDSSRIGITGVSLGGSHAWFATFVDTRYAVSVPIIGVQGFHWAIDKDKWQARVDSLKPVFEEARIDLGKEKIDGEVVKKVWDRIAPGLASEFDAPFTIPILAPRPLLILNGADDPRCPLGGLETPVSLAREAYTTSGFPDNFEMIAQPGIGHEMTDLMIKRASDWFDRFFKQNRYNTLIQWT